ncbi:MAG: arginase family protein, partial [Nitrososphaera sp.]|nr:arginase family protein [Nitrososphaera sp.]
EAISRIGDVQDKGDAAFSIPSETSRDTESGIIAYDSLISMIHALRSSVKDVLENSMFPLVIGGDCPVLLGCLAACKNVRGRTGLLFVDGHEDAYSPHQSPTGEAADMELGFALGSKLPEQIRKALGSVPLIDASNVCILGARDRKTLKKTNVRSLNGMIEFYSDVQLQQGSIASLTSKVVRRLNSKAEKFWLHIDLDVLSTKSLPAVDYRQPGGLSWKELEELSKTALSLGNIVGFDVTIYNPDFDPSGRFAKRIVRFLEAVLVSVH